MFMGGLEDFYTPQGIYHSLWKRQK